MNERVAFWLFGLALGGAIAGAIGTSQVAERGARKVLPVVCAGALALGVLLGWAINAYVDYLNASTTR